MVEHRVQRKELWGQLSNIKKNGIWLKAARRLGLQVTQPKGGSSHYALRLPGHETYDIKDLVATVHSHGTMRKDVNEKIFKCLLDAGFEEDEIWKALGVLKK